MIPFAHCLASCSAMLKFWKKSEKPEDPSPSEQASKKTWRERLAGSVLNRDIRDLFARHPKLDESLLDELETVLIGADVGVALLFGLDPCFAFFARNSADFSIATCCFSDIFLSFRNPAGVCSK